MEILLVFFLALLVLLLSGMPAAYAIALTSIAAIIVKWGTGSISMGLTAQMLVYGINSFPILAIPLFILTGAVMNSSGMSDRLFEFANAIVGHIRGGLAQVNCLASFMFSCMSGTAAADIAGLGQVEIRAMRKAGYDLPFSCAVTGASATLGPIFPPSVPLILYGVLANASVTALFLAGIVPGVLIVVALMILCAIISRIRGYPKGESFAASRLYRAAYRSIWPMATPVIIIGGIWSGIFTPTEAAGVAATFSIFVALFVYRSVTVGELFSICRRVSVDSAAILFILAAAMIYNTALTRTQAPEMVLEMLQTITENPLLMLLLLNAVLIIAGMFLSTTETILLLTPLLAPMLPQFGIDPIHFGILMIMNLMIGQLTPPFGIVLYVLMRIGDIQLDQLVRALWPFYIPLFIVLGLCIAFPPLVTWLPNYVLAR